VAGQWQFEDIKALAELKTRIAFTMLQCDTEECQAALLAASQQSEKLQVCAQYARSTD
jgi:hypothetical protein